MIMIAVGALDRRLISPTFIEKAAFSKSITIVPRPNSPDRRLYPSNQCLWNIGSKGGKIAACSKLALDKAGGRFIRYEDGGVPDLLLRVGNICRDFGLHAI